MKKNPLEQIGDFMAGKGFYIVLFLCVAAIGISGYYLFSSIAGPTVDVAGPAPVVVTPSLPPTPSVTPVKPSVPPTKKPVVPVPAPPPSVKPSPAPAPKVPAKTVSATATVFTWPVKGEVIDAFSPQRQRYDKTMGDWRTHSGMDISADIGTQVKAAAGGTVETVGQDDLLGTVLTIDHGDGVKSSYANLGEVPTVKAGDTVTTGDIIGAIGATAKGESATPPHLHFSMSKNGVVADPASYLPKLQ